MNPGNTTPPPPQPSREDLFTRLLTLICDADRGEDPFARSTLPPPGANHYRLGPARH